MAVEVDLYVEDLWVDYSRVVVSETGSLYLAVGSSWPEDRVRLTFSEKASAQLRQIIEAAFSEPNVEQVRKAWETHLIT